MPTTTHPMDDLDTMIDTLTGAGFDVDAPRARHLLAAEEALNAGDAAASAVPEADWKRAREALGLPVYEATS